jgi:hypothetical protein
MHAFRLILLISCTVVDIKPCNYHMLSDSLIVACMSIYGQLRDKGNTHLLFECTVISDTSVAGEHDYRLLTFSWNIFWYGAFPSSSLMSVCLPAFEFQVQCDSNMFCKL